MRKKYPEFITSFTNMYAFPKETCVFDTLKNTIL